ncbi:MAG: hypothetical protein K6F07_02240 [Bacilli bacterium]|nr:hypothetical protein [Bacilli bacterium]
MAINENTKKKFNFASYGIVVVFLCLEILAFLGFSLGQNIILYGCLSAVLFLLVLLVTFRQIQIDGLANYAFFLFPIFIYSLLSAISIFTTESDGAIGVLNASFVPIALTLFAASGYFITNTKSFDISKAMLVIYASLAVLVFINFVINMIYYVPFYTLIYKNYYIFFNGKPSPEPIGQTARMLFGFQVVEVSVQYWSLYPALLMSSGLGLFFISPKKNRKLFVIYACFAALGFVCLLFTPTRLTLMSEFIMIVALALFLVYVKFPKTHKAFKIAMYVFIVLFIVGFIILFLVSQSWSAVNGLKSFIAGNKLTNKLFNNGLLNPMKVILWEAFNKAKIFGSFVGNIASEGYGVYQGPSGSWIFDNILTSGIFGAAFFMFAFVMGCRQMHKYYVNDKDAMVNKVMLIGFVIALFSITLIGYDATPLINSNRLYPIYMFAPFIIALFLISYTYKNQEKEAQIAAINKQEEEKSHEEIVL